MADEATEQHLAQARQELASYEQQLANQNSAIAEMEAERDLSAARGLEPARADSDVGGFPGAAGARGGWRVSESEFEDVFVDFGVEPAVEPEGRRSGRCRSGRAWSWGGCSTRTAHRGASPGRARASGSGRRGRTGSRRRGRSPSPTRGLSHPSSGTSTTASARLPSPRSRPSRTRPRDSPTCRSVRGAFDVRDPEALARVDQKVAEGQAYWYRQFMARGFTEAQAREQLASLDYDAAIDVGLQEERDRALIAGTGDGCVAASAGRAGRVSGRGDGARAAGSRRYIRARRGWQRLAERTRAYVERTEARKQEFSAHRGYV